MANLLIDTIPEQIVNELAVYGPLDLKQYCHHAKGAQLNFSAHLSDGKSLPKGLICTSDGQLTGIPAKGTAGNYEFVVTVTSDLDQESLEVIIPFTIQYNIQAEISPLEEIKKQVWRALQNNEPIPDILALYDRPVTHLELCYLIERWGILTIWDAFNLEPASHKVLLDLPEVSPFYQIFDRGNSLIAAPKDLFDHKRTPKDALQTARALAKEVYRRNWTIEMAGVPKMCRAAWVELQTLGEKHGHTIEILNYGPTPQDIQIYEAQKDNALSFNRDSFD